MNVRLSMFVWVIICVSTCIVKAEIDDTTAGESTTGESTTDPLGLTTNYASTSAVSPEPIESTTEKSTTTEKPTLISTASMPTTSGKFDAKIETFRISTIALGVAVGVLLFVLIGTSVYCCKLKNRNKTPDGTTSEGSESPEVNKPEEWASSRVSLG